MQGLSWGKPADWGEVGWVGGVGGMQGRENPLQTPHLHVMEHLQNRDLPPERRAIDSRHNREIVPAADAPSSATKSAAGRCRGAADGAQNAAEKHGVTAGLRVEEQRLTEQEEISFHRGRSGQPCSPGPAVRCSRVRFAPSVL